MTNIKIDVKPREVRRSMAATFLTKEEYEATKEYAANKGVPVSLLIRSLLSAVISKIAKQ